MRRQSWVLLGAATRRPPLLFRYSNYTAHQESCGLHVVSPRCISCMVSNKCNPAESACMSSLYTAACLSFSRHVTALHLPCTYVLALPIRSASMFSLYTAACLCLLRACCCIVFALHLCLSTPHQLSKHFQLTHSTVLVLVRVCCCIAFATHLCLGTPC